MRHQTTGMQDRESTSCVERGRTPRARDSKQDAQPERQRRGWASGPVAKLAFAFIEVFVEKQNALRFRRRGQGPMPPLGLRILLRIAAARHPWRARHRALAPSPFDAGSAGLLGVWKSDCRSRVAEMGCIRLSCIGAKTTCIATKKPRVSPGLPSQHLFERAVYFFAAIIASRLARNALVLSQFGQLPSLATVLPTM